MISTIRNAYDFLTEAERRIADVVLDHPLAVVKMNVKEVAAEARTAPSAVIRFCKAIGVDGFSELKNGIVTELAKRTQTESLLPVNENDSVQDIFGKVFQSGIRTLQDTLGKMDFEEIEKIARLFTKANRVVFFGVGTSSVIAIDAHYRFAQLGISSSYCSDILFMNVTAANLAKGDVAVCISHSGRTKTTVDALRRAKKAGAVTVAISSYEHSLLVKESDYSVVAFSDDKNYPVEAVSAGVAHICIIDAFMMSIAGLNYKKLPEYMAQRNDVLRDMRYDKK